MCTCVCVCVTACICICVYPRYTMLTIKWDINSIRSKPHLIHLMSFSSKNKIFFLTHIVYFGTTSTTLHSVPYGYDRNCYVFHAYLSPMGEYYRVDMPCGNLIRSFAIWDTKFIYRALLRDRCSQQIFTPTVIILKSPENNEIRVNTIKTCALFSVSCSE